MQYIKIFETLSAMSTAVRCECTKLECSVCKAMFVDEAGCACPADAQLEGVTCELCSSAACEECLDAVMEQCEHCGDYLCATCVSMSRLKAMRSVRHANGAMERVCSRCWKREWDPARPPTCTDDACLFTGAARLTLLAVRELEAELYARARAAAGAAGAPTGAPPASHNAECVERLCAVAERLLAVARRTLEPAPAAPAVDKRAVPGCGCGGCDAPTAPKRKRVLVR